MEKQTRILISPHEETGQIRNHVKILQDEYGFQRFYRCGRCYDVTDEENMLRKHTNMRYYRHGDLIGAVQKDAADFIPALPKDTYIYVSRPEDNSDPIAEYVTLKNARILCLLHNNFEEILGAYIWLTLRCDSIDETDIDILFIEDEQEEIETSESVFHTVPAETLYQNVNTDILNAITYDLNETLTDYVEHITEHHIPMHLPRPKRDIKRLMEECRLNNKKFAEFVGTSVRNVENWRAKPDSISDYLYDLIEYKLLNEGYI